MVRPPAKHQGTPADVDLEVTIDVDAPSPSATTCGHVAVEEDRHTSKTHHHRVRPYSNEEKLQEDWRSLYIQLLSRSRKWEKTLELKDSTLQYLREALQDRDSALKRQEKLTEEIKQRLNFQGKSEKAHLEKKVLEVSLLRGKAIQQAEKLAEQTKLIGVLNSQQEQREQELLTYSNIVKRKVDKLQGRLKSAEASIQSRDEELEAYKKCCKELKIIIWKKNQMLEKSKHVEEQIQSTLKRKHKDCETLQAANNKLCGQNNQLAKSITEMKRNFEACETALQHDLKMQAFCLQKQKEQICRLEKMLRQKELCLQAKSEELEASYKEKERLVEEYATLNTEFKSLTHKHNQLQMVLEDLEEKVTMAHNCSMEEAISLYPEMPEQGSIPNKYESKFLQDISEDHSNFACGETGSLTKLQDAIGRGRPCLDAVSKAALLQTSSKHGIRQLDSIARPEMKRSLSSFEELRNEQACSSNQHETTTDVIADKYKSNVLDSSKADFHIQESSLTSFPKSASTVRNKWQLSDQVFILAEDDSCLETKVESKSTKNAVQSSTSSELQKIQEEIEERERRWKQIETRMRVELNRRKLQLHEANIL